MKKNKLLNVILVFVLGMEGMAQTTGANLESNLPIIILDTKGQAIVNDPKVSGTIKIINNGGGQINKVTEGKYYYKGGLGIELRGNSSQNFPQQQYGFETRDSTTGANFDVPLLGMPSDNDWVLYAPYNDVSMLRNIITYHLWNKMDHWGPHTRFCEVVINGDYKGVYILMESIKRGGKRVDVAKMTALDTAGIALTGGYIMKIDKKNNVADKSFISKVKSTNNQDITWLYHYPKADAITASQEAYIHRYIDTVEASIQASNFADPINGYAKYLSLSSFIDYLIVTELTKNTDAYKASTFFHKEKRALDGSKGKFKAGPVWDYNFAFGNASFCSGGTYTGWMYAGCNPATLPMPTMWSRLMQDPNFANSVKCRYTELRKGMFSETYLNTLVDGYVKDTLAQAQVRHFNRWKILGTNPGNFNAYVVASYAAEIQTLKTWISNRLKWMDANMIGTCVVSDFNDALLSQELQVYPNPFTDELAIQSSQNIVFVAIYNTLGQVVYEQPVSGGASFNISLKDMATGVYWLKCRTASGTTIAKMISKE